MAAGREVRIVEDAPAIAHAAAEEIVRASAAAVAARGRFVLALSGGRTPRAVYETLAAGGTPPYRERIEWPRAILVSGDERAVPPEHPDSNYRMAREALLSRVPVPDAHVIRFPVEEPDAESTVRRFEARLREVLGIEAGELPRFDVVLLGMGADGHTASLFPGTAAIAAAPGRIATWCHVPKLGAVRFSLTPAAINAAARTVFLVSGADKASTLREVLEGPRDPERLPAQIVAPSDGSVLWIVDRPAAGALRTLNS